MNLLDGIAAIFILFFAWKGFRNGLAKEVFRIVGLVLSGFIAFQYAEVIGRWLQPLFSISTDLIPYIAFALLFILALIAVQLGIVFLDTLIQLLLLSIPNRLFGALFGVLKSSLLLSIFVIFLAGFGVPDQDVRRHSLLYKPLLKVAPAAYDIVAGVLPGVKPYKDSVARYLSLPKVND
ncbi:MAG: CvpA family protein [Balneolales bacterium]